MYTIHKYIHIFIYNISEWIAGFSQTVVATVNGIIKIIVGSNFIPITMNYGIYKLSLCWDDHELFCRNVLSKCKA